MLQGGKRLRNLFQIRGRTGKRRNQKDRNLAPAVVVTNEAIEAAKVTRRSRIKMRSLLVRSTSRVVAVPATAAVQNQSPVTESANLVKVNSWTLNLWWIRPKKTTVVLIRTVLLRQTRKLLHRPIVVQSKRKLLKLLLQIFVLQVILSIRKWSEDFWYSVWTTAKGLKLAVEFFADLENNLVTFYFNDRELPT